MEWIRDVAPARAGDTGALERLREYLTPFVHGVLLAHAPHHVANRLVTIVLDDAFKSLAGVTDDSLLGSHVLAAARLLGAQRGATEAGEQSSTNAAVSEGRQLLHRLRALPESTRERLLLRLVEGVPGPEIAQVTHADDESVRADLERGAARALELLGQGASLIGDAYVWELGGTPLPALARLETQLTALRFDPLEAAEPPRNAESSSTWMDLTAEEPARRATFEAIPIPVIDGSTSVPTEPRVPTVPPPPMPNPFERGVATQHASDLPAEARGTMPAPEVPSPKSNPRMPPLGPKNPFEPTHATVPASDLPAAARGVVPKSSSSSKSGLRQLPEALISGTRLAQPASALAPAVVHDTKESVPLGEVEGDDATRAQVPRPLLAKTGEHDTALESDPRSAAVSSPDVMPLGARSMPELTSIKLVPSFFHGAAPFIVGAARVFAALFGGWLGLFSSERNAKRSWNLVPVLVAAEDLEEGAVINTENVSVRSVPDSFINTMAVKPEQIALVIDQRLAVAVQAGDPLLFNQFLYIRAREGLATRVMPKGRAFSISTNVLASVGRFVRPSDRVDIIVSFLATKDGRKPDENDRVAVTLVQNVPVIATGRLSAFTPERAVEERDRGYQDVSLLLIPEEVERLALAGQLGKIQLTLRAENDDRSLREAGQRLYSDVGTLLTGERVKALEQKRFEIIKVIRNTQLTPEGPHKKKL